MVEVDFIKYCDLELGFSLWLTTACERGRLRSQRWAPDCIYWLKTARKMIDPERLYSMQEAVYLVPMPSYSALMQFLYKNPRFARVYTRTRIKAVTGAWLTK